MQGAKMTNLEIHAVNSILTVKASGVEDHNVSDDLELPQGKSIAELIYDQEKQNINHKES
jgi:hypothetical protein